MERKYMFFHTGQGCLVFSGLSILTMVIIGALAGYSIKNNDKPILPVIAGLVLVIITIAAAMFIEQKHKSGGT